MRLCFFLILLSAPSVHAQSDNTQSESQINAYRALAEHDKRLANIGYRLSQTNADFCRDVLPRMGWVLHDIAQYPGPELARAAFTFESPISVLHVVKGAPADLAGVQVGDGFIGINYHDDSGVIRTSPIEDSDKTNDFERMARTTAHIGHALSRLAQHDLTNAPLITVVRDGETLSLPFAINSGCASDYILDARDKIDAGANGRHVRVTLGVSRFIMNDDEYAALVAHELAHNILKHRERLEAAKRGEGPMAKFGRNKRIKTIEEEADRLSVWLMSNAGFDVNAAATFHERLGKRKGKPFLGSLTHNKWRQRVGFVKEEISILNMTAPIYGKLRPPPMLAKSVSVRKISLRIQPLPKHESMDNLLS